jgi:hypothetical protein
VPAHTFNYAFVPPHLRVPYVTFMSLNWSVYTCVVNGRLKSAPGPDAEPTALLDAAGAITLVPLEPVK